MDQILYESIGHPLKNCLNIVVTRQDVDFSDQGVATKRSLKEALAYASQMHDANLGKNDDVFCIGGAEMYRQAMPIADKIYLTRSDREYKGDTFFPEIDMKIWRCVYSFCSGWHGKPDDRFLAYFLEFDKSKISNPTL
jgi:dihydrofolate reductase